MKSIVALFLTLQVPFAGFAGSPKTEQVVNIEVTEKGFVPNKIDVKPKVPVVLNVTRKTDQTCSTEIQIPDKKINKKLPLNETVVIAVGPLEKGEIRFGCGMNMMDGGKIFVR